MLYYIGYFPPKEFQDFYTDLISDIGQRFQLDELVQRRRIPHITLKSPFEISSTKSLKSLDKLISNFCQNQKPSKIFVSGVGNFGEDVIFLNCQPSVQMTCTFNGLLCDLRNIKLISWSEYDNEDKKLHITLAKKDELKGKFRDVFDYLSTKYIDLVLPFDNMALFKKESGRNAVHRLYYLGSLVEI